MFNPNRSPVPRYCKRDLRDSLKKGGFAAAPNRLWLWSHRADFPNHTRTGKLDERAVGGIQPFRGGIRLTVVSNRAVIRDIGATVRAESDVGRPVKAAQPIGERLLKRCIMGEPLDLQGERRAGQLIEVD